MKEIKKEKKEKKENIDLIFDVYYQNEDNGIVDNTSIFTSTSLNINEEILISRTNFKDEIKKYKYLTFGDNLTIVNNATGEVFNYKLDSIKDSLDTISQL